MNLAEAEASPAAEKLFPRFRQSAAVLCGVYGGLTLVEAILLCFAKMPLWESVCHALATAGTGGFSTRNLGIAAYQSPAVESIIAFFMLIFGVNLKLVWLFVTGRAAQALKNEELRWYAGIVSGILADHCGQSDSGWKSVGECLGAGPSSKPPARSAPPASPAPILTAGRSFAGCFCP